MFDFWFGFGGGPSASGETVGREKAMRLYSVYACVTVIADSIAQLPLKLKQNLPDGSTKEGRDNRLSEILKLIPNPRMTSFTWRESGFGHILLDGNKYSFIEKSRLGIKALWPIDPKFVTPKLHARLNVV